MCFLFSILSNLINAIISKKLKSEEKIEKTVTVHKPQQLKCKGNFNFHCFFLTNAIHKG